MCGGVVGDVLDAGQDVLDTVSDAGSDLDDFVNEEIPGGWATVGLAAAGVYYAPEIGAYVSSEGAVLGATEAEAAATLSATEAGAGSLAASDAAFNSALANSGAATAADVAAGTAGATTAGGVVGGATTGGAAAGGAAAGATAGGITLGQVGSALAIASAVNSLSGGAITNAITGGPDTNVNTGGGTDGGIDGGNDGNGSGNGNGGGNTDISTAGGSLKVADPFSPYRSKLAQMYSGYLTGGNKTDITQMPGYSQFESGVLNPALEATKRAGAKSGMLMSGNEQIALQKQGQTGYYNFMTDYLNRLATGSGATNNPYNAAALSTGQANTQNQATMQGFGGLLTGVGGLLGSNAVSGTNLSNLFGGNNNYWNAQNTQAVGDWMTQNPDITPASTFNGSEDASWMSDYWMQ